MVSILSSAERQFISLVLSTEDESKLRSMKVTELLKMLLDTELALLSLEMTAIYES